LTHIYLIIQSSQCLVFSHHLSVFFPFAIFVQSFCISSVLIFLFHFSVITLVLIPSLYQLSQSSFLIRSIFNLSYICGVRIIWVLSLPDSQFILRFLFSSVCDFLVLYFFKLFIFSCFSHYQSFFPGFLLLC
jgi:hypothetical protein